MRNKNITNIEIWECLKNGFTLEKIINEFSNETHGWIKQQTESFMTMFTITKDLCEMSYFTNIYDTMTKDEKLTKISMMPENYQKPLLFLSEGKDIDSLVWDIVQPKITNKFKNDKI